MAPFFSDLLQVNHVISGFFHQGGLAWTSLGQRICCLADLPTGFLAVAMTTYAPQLLMNGMTMRPTRTPICGIGVLHG
jgi:hypothetical protein